MIAHKIIQLSGLWYLTLVLPCQRRSASARNSLLGSLLLMLIINVRIANSNINGVADIKTYLKLTHLLASQLPRPPKIGQKF